MDKDAKLNDFIRLKQAPIAPVERWQLVPTVRGSAFTSTRPATAGSTIRRTGLVAENKSTRNPASPLRQIPTNNTQGKCFSTTPEASRLKVKTPSRSRSTTSSTATYTPGLHKTPKSAQNTPGRNSQTPSSCRFIPNRATTDVEYSSFLLRQKENIEAKKEEEIKEEGDDGDFESPPAGREEYRRGLLTALTRSRGHQQKGVLSFKSATPSASNSYLEYTTKSSEASSSVCNSHTKSAYTSTCRFPITPEKVLDAPTLSDDYYLNTLDWGRNNLVAIGLGSSVYLWNANDGSSCPLMDLKGEGQYVTSVSWSGNSKYLAIGDSSAAIQLWDAEKQKKIRTMKGHSDRVGVLAWNKHTVASASRDGIILHNDVRKASHVIAESRYHQQEVCGMQWSPDGTKLASGANDNLVCVWSAGSLSQPTQLFKGHQAAVKAVAWCPWKPNTLATGGGSRDKCIRFWNVFTGQCTEVIDTKAPVSCLQWNKYHKQLISAHGQPRNHMVIWQYPNMTKLGSLTGHTERILHMTLSPRRSRVASASSDETMRIWKCFERMKQDLSQRSYSEDSISALMRSFS